MEEFDLNYSLIKSARGDLVLQTSPEMVWSGYGRGRSFNALGYRTESLDWRWTRGGDFVLVPNKEVAQSRASILVTDSYGQEVGTVQKDFYSRTFQVMTPVRTFQGSPDGARTVMTVESGEVVAGLRYAWKDSDGDAIGFIGVKTLALLESEHWWVLMALVWGDAESLKLQLS